jgi:hypothetical protein
MKNKILTGIQVLLVVIWAIASYTVDRVGFNPFIFNILPIPNFGLMLITFILIAIGYWLQKMKDKNTGNG